MTLGTVVIGNVADDLGQALAREVCTRGHPVAGLASNPEDLAAAGEAGGPLFKGFLCDLADLVSIREVFSEIRSRLGPVGILINGAPPCLRRDILDESAESFMAGVHLSLGSIVGCTREALTDMVAEGRGRILTIGAGADVVPASAACLVSREAIQAFSRALVADLADRFPGILVSQWYPRVLQRSGEFLLQDALAQAAEWGATLALSREPSLNGSFWVDDHEILLRRGLRQVVSDWLMGRRHVQSSITLLEAEASA